MDSDSEIRQFLDKITKKLRTLNESEILDLIPGHSNNHEEIIKFLNASYRLFKNSFCFRPKIAHTFIKQYAEGDYLTLIYFIPDSDRALEINLLRMEHLPSENRLFSSTSYTLSITEFNYKKTIGSISDYRLLVDGSPETYGERFLKEAEMICELRFIENHYWGILDRLIELFIYRKERKIKKEIYREFQKMERDMKWFAKEKIKTFKS